MLILRLLAVLLLSMCVLPVGAAPELTESQRQQLEDGTDDRNATIDERPGLYALLRNALGWQADDFSGDAGAKTAPEPDYDYIRANPAQARGSVYLIEGWLAQHDRFPTEANFGRDQMRNSLDVALGSQVTRWTIATAKKDPASTVIVLFLDAQGHIKDPGKESKVRVAARFFKLWTYNDASGTPVTYPVFVAGAHEVVTPAKGGSSGSAPSPRTLMMIGLVVVVGGFFLSRYLLNRNSGGGGQTRQRISELREAREHAEEHADDESAEDLPEDPVAALDQLRDRHETSD